MKEAADQLIHGGDRIGAVLRAHGGVHLCGGHISPILAGAKARGICVVDVRDEVTALLAAARTLSSESKCNTPADLIIGTVDQDLRECCHAMLFAFVG